MPGGAVLRTALVDTGGIDLCRPQSVLDPMAGVSIVQVVCAALNRLLCTGSGLTCANTGGEAAMKPEPAGILALVTFD